MARCSADCGRQPSLASTTNRAQLTPPTPASMLWTNRSWPGTSTKPTSRPDGRVVQANPRSMVRPRAFSSASRSGSVPVRAWISADLPWSTWPAVPMTCGIRVRRTPGDPRGRREVPGPRPAPAPPPRPAQGARCAGRARPGPARPWPPPGVAGTQPGQHRGRPGRGRVDLDEHALHALPWEAAAAGHAGPGAQGGGRPDRGGQGGGPWLELGHGQQQGPPHGQLVAAAGQVGGQGRLQGGQGELVGPDRPGQRVPGQPPDQLGPAHDQAGLRAAEELVAGEQHQVGAGGQAAGDRRLVPELAGQQPRPDVVEQRQAVLVGQGGQLAEGRAGGEPLDPVVGRVHGQHQPRVRAEPGGVVAQVGAVGGADLAQRHPAASMISGSRNSPPISISSPRETSTSRPRASPSRARSSAPAALFTTSAASAPVASRSSASAAAPRRPRVPAARSYSTAAYPAASATAALAAADSGARPRFVWSTTPVAFTTARVRAAGDRPAPRPPSPPARQPPGPPHHRRPPPG